MANLERHPHSESANERKSLSSSKNSRKPDMQLEGWSRDRLYRRAVELDIEGRSKMTKAQLVYALQEH